MRHVVVREPCRLNWPSGEPAVGLGKLDKEIKELKERSSASSIARTEWTERSTTSKFAQ